MNPNLNDPSPSEEDGSSADSPSPELTPPQQEVNQLSSLAVDPASLPTPGLLISPSGDSAGNEAATSTELPNNLTEPVTNNVAPESSAANPISPELQTQPPAAPAAAYSATSQVPPEPQIQTPSSQPVEPTSTMPPSTNTPAAPQPTKKKSRSKLILLIILVIVIIAGGSAAAYFGIVVPNRPANVLRDAFVNSLQQPNTNFSMTTKVGSVDVGLNGLVNRNAKAADLNLNLTYSDITIPLDARFVDNRIYLKLGDLSKIATMLEALSPSSSTEIQAISSEISNQWFILDTSLVNQSSYKCYTGASWNFSQSDIQKLENTYKTNSFFNINSASSVTLNGQKAEKFSLTVNGNKLTNYFDTLGDKLSIIKQLEQCSGAVNKQDLAKIKDKASTATASTDNTPITVWVDKSSKQIVQVASNTAVKEDGSTTNVNLTVTINHNPASISVPANAQSIKKLITEAKSQLNSNSSSTTSDQSFTDFLSSLTSK